MTSEIALMNDMSVAFAADSAGSWLRQGPQRQVFNTADKIYQLAGRQPVGFMNYGNGSYMGVSWDRIFGMYREEVGAREKSIEPGPTEARELSVIESNPPNTKKSYWEPASSRPGGRGSWRWTGRKGIKDMTVVEIKAELKEIKAELSKQNPPLKGPTLTGKKQELWDRLKEFQPEPKHGYVEHFIEWLESRKEFPSNDLRTAHELAELINSDVPLLGIYVGIMEQSDKAEFATQNRTAEEIKGLTTYRKGLEDLALEQLAKKWEKKKRGLDLRKHKTLLRTEKKTLDALVDVITEQTEIWLSAEMRHKSFIKGGTKRARDARRNIVNLGCAYLTCDDWPINYSGIVVAGFGKKEDQPSLVHLRIYSKRRDNLADKDVLRVRRVSSGDHGCYHPFAMSDNIKSLFEGIHPRRKAILKSQIKIEWPVFFTRLASKTKGISPKGELTKSLSKNAIRFFDDDGKEYKLLDEFFTEVDNWSEYFFKRRRGNQYSLESSIPKLDPSDLANLAGNLVDIECAIQYVSNAGRPVGGPVDVASITKEDGLVWVRRKDTLDKDLNPRIHHHPRNRGRYI